MGRRFPVDENQEFHPLVSLSLLIACIAATMAIVSSLCGEKRKEDNPNSSDGQKKVESSEVVNPPNESDVSNGTARDGESLSSTQGEERLPPPPGAHSRAASYHIRSTSSVATPGKLLSTMSMKVSGGVKDLHQHHKEKKEKKLKHEDSIWQKTIILGEKCKVPDDDDDDAILYDEKGNRISAYHKKAPTSVALSRQTSSIDPDVIPNKESETKREKEEKK